MYDSYPWQSKHYLNILEPYLFISYSYFSYRTVLYAFDRDIFKKQKKVTDLITYLLFFLFSKAIHLKFTFFLMVTSPFY